MKTALVIGICCCLLNATLHGQHTFTLHCNIEGAKGHKIYLADSYGGYLNPQNPYSMDSLIAQSDTFSFSGSFKEHKLYSLLIDTSRGFVAFIIDTGLTTIRGQANLLYKASIRNSKQNEWYRNLANSSYDIVLARNKVVQLKHTDTINATKHNKVYDSLTTEWKNVLESFIRSHPDSYAAFHDLNEGIGNKPHDLEWKKKVFPFFSDLIKSSDEGRQFAYKYFKYETDTILEGTFPVIEAFDIHKNMNKVQLNPENVYLIDYWASWCVPCIQKLPEIKKQYAAYKDKGFNVLSLSLDWKYEDWIKAVRKHEIPWANYSALKGFDTKDAKYFNVTAIPYTILVGRGNKIIKLNPTEEEVKAYLKVQLK